MFETFALLTLAVLTLWVGGNASVGWRRYISYAVLVAAIVVGMLTYVVRPLGMLWIVLLGVALWDYFRAGAPLWEKIAAALVILVLCAGLMTHFLPGFANPRVISNLRFGPDSIPYSLYLNFDKAAAGILLLALGHARMRHWSEWRAMLRVMIPFTIGLMIVLSAASYAAGYIRFEPKAPSVALTWMWVNLFFTCVPEEALFRAFIQTQLTRALESSVGPTGAKWIALVTASVVFGVAHGNGGTTYVVLATLAGLGYGWIYQRTVRIEASILTHFAVNTAHFFLMSYPALQR